MTAQASLCWSWSESQIVGFIMRRLILYFPFQRSSCIGSIDMMTVQSVVQKKTMGGGKKFEIITATNTYRFVRSVLFCHLFSLSPGHMDRFTHVCKFCVYANFTHVSKSVRVTAIFPLLRIRKICIYAKFALGLEQVQISKFTFTYVSKICIHANLSM